jgi:hypothetical protein
MLKMWCAGRLGNCPTRVASRRFRFTCLYCRWRRQWLGKYTPPKFWIKYTYRSLYRTERVKHYIAEGKEYSRVDGGDIIITKSHTLRIDPRGHFTSLRIAAIIVLDKTMKLTKQYKPFVEWAELLANYPNW